LCHKGRILWFFGIYGVVSACLFCRIGWVTKVQKRLWFLLAIVKFCQGLQSRGVVIFSRFAGNSFYFESMNAG